MTPTNLWIKICGNTSLEDALLAAEAGADAVGFVFAPSPRRVTPAQVAAIVPHLPATLEKIGVFVDASFEEIEATVNTSSLTGVQLHFDAAPDLTAQLRARFGLALRILRVIHFDAHQASEKSSTVSEHEFRTVSGHDFSRAARPEKSTWALAPEVVLRDPNIDAVLVDSRTATATGGTGQSFDWNLASNTLFQNNEQRKQRLVAAGGLNPENVAEAIAALQPWGVDVVSGVESSPGRKDPDRVRALIANAKAEHRR
jgi:phosphoribosylanthranilate isomerase